MKTNGQTPIEFVVLIILVIVGIMVMSPYAKRAINAHLKGWEDAVDDSMNDPMKQASESEITGLVSSCKPDGKCDSPYETPISCCQDCPEETGGSVDGDGICCNPKELASTSIDCAKCGDGYCAIDPTSGAFLEVCCQDCGGDIPNDGDCCVDSEGNPAGGDVSGTDCSEEQCNFDTHCDAGETKISCCLDCFDPFDGTCSSCEDQFNAPDDCCEKICKGNCSNSGCWANCKSECCSTVAGDSTCDALCGETWNMSMCLNGRCDYDCGEPESVCPQDCLGCDEDDEDACLGKGAYSEPDPSRCYCYDDKLCGDYSFCTTGSDPSMCYDNPIFQGCCKQQWGDDGHGKTFCSIIPRIWNFGYCGGAGNCTSGGWCAGGCVNRWDLFPTCQECFP